VLFGGGQGEMRLTDETNLAESGIDILASPPGKKLQNVALSSGGEKADGDGVANRDLPLHVGQTILMITHDLEVASSRTGS
jgi:hypothetical protein